MAAWDTDLKSLIGTYYPADSIFPSQRHREQNMQYRYPMGQTTALVKKYKQLIYFHDDARFSVMPVLGSVELFPLAAQE